MVYIHACVYGASRFTNTPNNTIQNKTPNRAAQYRYEVLKTLEEVQQATILTTITAQPSPDEAVLGKAEGGEIARRARALERKDARILQGDAALSGTGAMGAVLFVFEGLSVKDQQEDRHRRGRRRSPNHPISHQHQHHHPPKPNQTSAVNPEDLDSLLQQMEALVRDEQQWARLASACVGAGVGLAAFPTHDFFGVLAGGWVRWMVG